MSSHVGGRQLRMLAARLAQRDWAILTDLAQFRLLTGQQIHQLWFTGGQTNRTSRRALRRLATLRLIDHLDRRIGGVRAGSNGYIWHLTSTGARLLDLQRTPDTRRPLISAEPSLRMVDHMLACAEVGVALREQATAQTIELLTLETEPDCWRDWLDGAGIRRLLKPDLFTVTAATESTFEQLWFLEIDRGSESVATLTAKAAAYATYQASGAPITHHGVMPLVAWITPDERRAQTIARAATSGDPSGVHQPMTLPRFIAAVTEHNTPHTDGAAGDSSPGG